MTNADVLLNYLLNAGIKTIFGVPGGAIEPFYDSISKALQQDMEVNSVIARHESGAALMAEGYYREMNELAVCCSTSGPGASNAITGVSSAYAENIPMIVITGSSSIRSQGKGALQEGSDAFMNTLTLFDNCTAYNTLISNSSQFDHKVITAINYAITKSKPVHLCIPVDVMREINNTPSYDFSFKHLKCDNVNYDIISFMQDATSNKKVTVLLGKGASTALPSIKEAVQANNWLCAVTPDGKGLIEESFLNYTGVLGFAGHDSAYRSVHKDFCDCVISVGVTMNEVSTSGWDKNLQLFYNCIQLDYLESRLLQSSFIGTRILGSLYDIFSAFNNVVSPVQNNHKKESLITYNPVDKHENIHVTDLLECLDLNLMPDYRLYSDSGCSYLWSIHYSKVRKPLDDNRSLFQIGIGTSTMSWAIGASVGAAMALKIANDDAPVVCLTGDGSYLMSGQELTTAVEENLNVVFIILNDSSLGMVKHGQRLANAERIGTNLPSINFTYIADSLGIQSLRVETPEDLNCLSDLRFDKGPVLIDVIVDKEAVPPMKNRMKVLIGE